MSMLRCVPVAVFRARTIQPTSSLLEAICAPGHKIVSSSTTPAPTLQSFPITEQPRIRALGSTTALGFVAAQLLGRIAASAQALCLRSEEHTSELQSRFDLVCRLLLVKK